MSGYPYLPLSTDAYLADTRHLSTVEHGAYLLLLIEAWRRPDCSLPDDDDMLARLAGLSANDWQNVKLRVMAFWKRDGRKKSWTQKRLLSERLYVAEKRKTKQDNAAKRWKKKKNDDAPAMRNGCKTDAPPPPPPQLDIAGAGSARVPRDNDPLRNALIEAMGPLAFCAEKYSNFYVTSEPLNWLANDCDLEADILPAIRAKSIKMAQKRQEPKGWMLFSEAVFEARDRRLAPAPPVQQRAASPPRQERQHFNQNMIEAFAKIAGAAYGNADHDTGTVSSGSSGPQRIDAGPNVLDLAVTARRENR